MLQSLWEMYVCMCVCMCVCTYVCMYVYVCTYVCLYVCMYVCTYVCMNFCTYVYVRMYSCMYVSLYVTVFILLYLLFSLYFIPHFIITHNISGSYQSAWSSSTNICSAMSTFVSIYNSIHSFTPISARCAAVCHVVPVCCGCGMVLHVWPIASCPHLAVAIPRVPVRFFRRHAGSHGSWFNLIFCPKIFFYKKDRFQIWVLQNIFEILIKVILRCSRCRWCLLAWSHSTISACNTSVWPFTTSAARSPPSLTWYVMICQKLFNCCKVHWKYFWPLWNCVVCDFLCFFHSDRAIIVITPFTCWFRRQIQKHNLVPLNELRCSFWPMWCWASRRQSESFPRAPSLLPDSCLVSTRFYARPA